VLAVSSIVFLSFGRFASTKCEHAHWGLLPAGSQQQIANPDMASVETRIETFKEWPRPEMNAHKLAAAGFFYAPIPGCKDRCIFYASGNALFNWVIFNAVILQASCP
jgi:hypothetical protein